MYKQILPIFAILHVGSFFLFNCLYPVKPYVLLCASVIHAFHQGFFITFFFAEAFILHHNFLISDGRCKPFHGSVPPLKTVSLLYKVSVPVLNPLHSALIHRLSKLERVSEPDVLTISRRIDHYSLGLPNSLCCANTPVHLPATGETACCCDSIISMGFASFSDLCCRWQVQQYLSSAFLFNKVLQFLYLDSIIAHFL